MKKGQIFPKVKFVTLGCRVNQYETQAVREQFLAAQYEETQNAGEADVVVVNTCTVTGESDRQSRYAIRKCHRDSPNAKIVVTGCYVEKDRKTVEAIDGVSLAVSNEEKVKIVRLLESCASFSSVEMGPVSKRQFSSLSISHFDGRTRAYVKIQDGCNHACSFCKVVLVRGPARSRPFNEIVEEVKRLATAGYREVVLTGIQLGAFGFDWDKRKLLPELLKQLSDIEGMRRIRLSSIEPTDITGDLMEVMASSGKMCPHLHIPLQSGSDAVLKRMNRRYGRDFFRNLIQNLNERIKDFVLTTDVMIGFPGETDAEFRETIGVLEEAKPYKLHIFPYSRREGTRAARLTDVVSKGTVRQRYQFLSEKESEWREAVMRRFLDSPLEVLVEEGQLEDNWIEGRAANFILVRCRASAGNHNGFLDVFVDRMEGASLIGRLNLKEPANDS